jgi:hypothetical protein
MSAQVLDYSLTAFNVPGLSQYTPPFGTKKADGVGLTTTEINRNIMMPFMKQRSIAGIPAVPGGDPPMGVITVDSIAQPIEFDATFAVGEGITLQLDDPAYEGQKLTLTGSFSAGGDDATIILGIAGEPVEIGLSAGEVMELIAVNSAWTRFSGGGQGGDDVTNIIVATSYHPGTGVGGITWTDPAVAFDYIEIEDLLVPGIYTEVVPGVQRFNPPAGTHQYRIRAVFSDGSKTTGVELPSQTYSIIYTSNLVSATVPQSNPSQLILTFDNIVSATNSVGLSLGGMTDSLNYVDQPNDKSLRFQLATKLFVSGASYTVSYSGTGTLKQDDNSSVAAWSNLGVTNNSEYATASLQNAQIPSAEPSTLVLVFGKAVGSIDISKFSLSGTTASIASLVSPINSAKSATVQFKLSEPVDASETAITVSMASGGAIDADSQSAPVFSNQPVVNNSTHVAIMVDFAEVPANAPSTLIVVMEGAVTIGGATSGSSVPTGWSFSYAGGQGDAPSMGAWTISDGTITFALSEAVLQGKTPTLIYNGSDSTFKAVATGDIIGAFSKSVTNNSTDTGGVPPGSNPRNLAITLLGVEPADAADVTIIVNKISKTIRNGNIANLVVGDYFGLPSLTIAAGHDSGGAFSKSSNEEITGHGRWLDMVIVSKNGLKNKNGNTADHVIVQSRNVLSVMTSVSAGGHYMETTSTNQNGYSGSKGRQFLINEVLTGLQNAGIPFNTDAVPSLTRKVANKGSGATGLDTITDKIWLPTEWELFGANTYSWSSGNAAETDANQGRLEFYQAAADRIKYALIGGTVTAVYWWEASPCYSASNYFCYVNTNGSANYHNAVIEFGVAPAFPIG